MIRWCARIAKSSNCRRTHIKPLEIEIVSTLGLAFESAAIVVGISILDAFRLVVVVWIRTFLAKVGMGLK